MRQRQRDAENRIRAQVALVLGAIQLDHALIQRDLIERVEAGDRVLYRLVDVLHGLQDALAAVALCIAIAQFHRLVRASGCARRHDRRARRAAEQRHRHLHGRIAA